MELWFGRYEAFPKVDFGKPIEVRFLSDDKSLTYGLRGKAGFYGGNMEGLFQRMLFPALFLAAFAASGGLTKSKTVSADTVEIEHGRYLVEEVAKCPECHTPRNARGELDHQAWLQGAPIWIMPVRPISNWADRAPALAGFPSFTEEQGERVLEKRTGPQGEILRPPMHTYHMNHGDATAIIAYLKSLPRSVH